MVLREFHFEINNDYETPKDTCEYKYNYFFKLEGYCSSMNIGFMKLEIGKGNDFTSALDYAYNNAYNRLKYKHSVIADIIIYSDYYIIADNFDENKDACGGHALYNVNSDVDFMIGLLNVEFTDDLLDNENIKTKKLILDELFKISSLYENDELKKQGLEYLASCNYDKAFYELGFYYDYKKDYELMVKYYEMAIDKCNNIDAMHNLAFYYEMINQNDELAEKYYLMILDNKKDTSAMFKLGRYYLHNKDDNIKAEKYFRMTIKNCVDEKEKKYYSQLIKKLK